MLSGTTMGKSGASPLFVMKVFKVPVTKELITPDNINRFYSQIMTGLCSLFNHDVICKITMSDTGNEKKTISKCYCTEFIPLVRHQLPWESVVSEVVVIQTFGNGHCSLVLDFVGLHVVCEVIHNDEDFSPL